MILIYSTHHEPAPLLDQPLEENNAQRELRPIIFKARKVRGKTGWLLRRYGYIFGAPRNDPEGVAHHALQIGAYVYEMTREKGLVGQRLTGEQIWPSTIKHAVIGYTDLADEDIQMQSIKAEAHSRARGNYHIKHNNCQHFISELHSLITKSTVLSNDSEVSSMKSDHSSYASQASTLVSGKTALEVTTTSCGLEATMRETRRPPVMITITELSAAMSVV